MVPIAALQLRVNACSQQEKSSRLIVDFNILGDSVCGGVRNKRKVFDVLRSARSAKLRESPCKEVVFKYKKRINVRVSGV